jgi:hypothetical protein
MIDELVPYRRDVWPFQKPFNEVTPEEGWSATTRKKGLNTGRDVHTGQTVEC